MVVDRTNYLLSNFIKERNKKIMIKISRDEAIAIRNNLRGVPVVIANRQSKSKAKTYYVESSPYVMRFLTQIHKNDKVEHFE